MANSNRGEEVNLAKRTVRVQPDTPGRPRPRDRSDPASGRKRVGPNRSNAAGRNHSADALARPISSRTATTRFARPTCVTPQIGD